MTITFIPRGTGKLITISHDRDLWRVDYTLYAAGMAYHAYHYFDTQEEAEAFEAVVAVVEA